MTIPLLPGSMIVTPDGEVHDADDLCEMPEGGIVCFDRWFVAVNVVLADGQHCFGVLTPYLYSCREVEEQCAELSKVAPGCMALCARSVLDPSIPAQRIELDECTKLFAKARREDLQ
jgi:hypothetical protein